MAYAKKYYTQFAELETDDIHVVEFWEDGFADTAEEVKCAEDDPFVVEMPELEHKFQAVRGNGCRFNLLSDTDRKFFDGLYHVDPQDFQILHYINGTLNWCGYLNSEFVSEPYDVATNYLVSGFGNNGFSLMDRFAFVQADGTMYEGVMSQWEILQIIFDKIGLPFTYFYIYLSTTVPGYTPATGDSLLHYSYVDCANFYDEDEQAMTLREVIESILQPYGAFIEEYGANIYITDIHGLASSTNITYLKYNASTYAYIGTEVIDNVTDVYDAGYLGTGHSIERSGGKNMQKIIYSPYPFKEIYRGLINKPEEFATVPGSFSTKYGFYYRTLEDHNLLILPNTPPLDASFEESYRGTRDGDPHYVYLRWEVQGTNYQVAAIDPTKLTYLNIFGATPVPLPNRYQYRTERYNRYLNGAAFLITGKILVKTKDNPYIGTPASKDIVSVGISYVMTCGSKEYDKDNAEWITGGGSTINLLYSYTDRNEIIADKWIEIGEGGAGELIPIGAFDVDLLLDGDLQLLIESDIVTASSDSVDDYVENSSDIQEIWLRDLSIKVVNVDGSEIEDIDNEFVGYLDNRFIDAAETITLKLGTIAQYSDRGKILLDDSGDLIPITEWVRNSQQYKIEELLLCSLCSNFKIGHVSLINMNLKRTFSLINILTDTTFITNNLMIKSYVVNYRNHTINCNLVEIFTDELTIVEV